MGAACRQVNSATHANMIPDIRVYRIPVHEVLLVCYGKVLREWEAEEQRGIARGADRI